MDKPDTDNKGIFGFWLYLMTDLVMFAVLFAAFAVLRNNTFGGPELHKLFENISFVLVETFILLTSSFTCGVALICATYDKKAAMLSWLGATFLLGTTFLVMELTEFSKLIHEGNGWQKSASLSSFFALVGTHGLHIAIGLLWLIILFVYVLKKGLGVHIIKKLTLFSLFWHFLDLVWIFIFSMVYLLAHA